MIKTIIAKRPTYGYRRVTAILNRLLRESGRPNVNHKRIYRIMKQYELMFEPAPQKPVRTHDGKVIVAESDSRYCSDTFEIWCWDNRVVRVAFVLDCCDREVITWYATNAGINGEMIRDLMADAVTAANSQAIRPPVRFNSATHSHEFGRPFA
jgi:putative transposase